MHHPDHTLAPFSFWTALAAAAALGLAGCATPAGPQGNAAPAAAAPAQAAAPTRPAADTPGTAASAPGTAASAPTAAARPDAAAPRPFADVSKSATREDGFVPLWREKEKVWLEIAPERLGKPFLFSVNIAQSVGERGLYGGQMGARWLVEFRRIGNQMQLVAKQVGFRSPGDAQAIRAVGEGFSESLIASAPVASAEHPERKSVLVDASFLLGDVAGYSTRLEQAYRLPFAADRTNSFFEATRAEAGLSTLSTKVHFAVARIPAPPLLPPGAVGPGGIGIGGFGGINVMPARPGVGVPDIAVPDLKQPPPPPPAPGQAAPPVRDLPAVPPQVGPGR